MDWGKLTRVKLSKTKTCKFSSVTVLKPTSLTIYGPDQIASLFLNFFLFCPFSEGPKCQDEMGNKCEIETYYYPEKSSTSVDQHMPVSVKLMCTCNVFE